MSMHELDRLILSTSSQHPDHEWLLECLSKGLIQSQRLLEPLQAAWSTRLGEPISRSKALWVEALVGVVCDSDALRSLSDENLYILCSRIHDAMASEGHPMHSEGYLRSVASAMVEALVAPMVWNESFESEDTYASSLIQGVTESMGRYLEKEKERAHIGRQVERALRKKQGAKESAGASLEDIRPPS